MGKINFTISFIDILNQSVTNKFQINFTICLCILEKCVYPSQLQLSVWWPPLPEFIHSKDFFTNCKNSEAFQMIVIRNTMISHHLPKQRWIQGRLFPWSPVFQQSWQRHGNKEDFMRWVVMVMTWLCGKIDSNIIETEQLRWHLWFGKGCLFSFFLVFFYHFFRWLKNFGGMANAVPHADLFTQET